MTVSPETNNRQVFVMEMPCGKNLNLFKEALLIKGYISAGFFYINYCTILIFAPQSMDSNIIITEKKIRQIKCYTRKPMK
jgi:hypothetical protein